MKISSKLVRLKTTLALILYNNNLNFGKPWFLFVFGFLQFLIDFGSLIAEKKIILRISRSTLMLRRRLEL